MNIITNPNIQLGREIALLSEYLPKSPFPPKVARVEIIRESSPMNPRNPNYMSPMWHFISVDRNNWSFDETEYDGNAYSRTDAINTICQEFGVTFNWDGDELEDDTLIKLIRNAKRKGVIVALDRNYYTDTFSSHGDMLDNHAYAYISLKEIESEYGDSADAQEKALKYLQGELDLYNWWINNDVWYFVSYNENGEMISSCGGYYGESENGFKYIKSEAGVTPKTIVEIED